MKVTLKDIAEALDVSITTVSRAINNQGRVGTGTRQQILDKARELGYEIKEDSLAYAPQLGGKMVGVVFSKRLQSLATDPFYSTVMLGVEKQ